MIIKSILDTDLYKLSMMNYVLELFPNTKVTYKFKNRGSQRFNQDFLTELQKEINNLANLKLTNEEYFYLKEKFPYLTHGFLGYLKNFRYNPKNVVIRLTEDNNLELEIKGLWVETIKFEVVLMAIISELYFKIIDTDWNYKGQEEKALEKIKKLSENKCLFIDMGSRRRRSFKNQELVIETFTNYSRKNTNSSFLGTSNIYFSRKYGLKCFGTMGHEIIMHSAVAEGLRNANYFSLMNWKRIFVGNLGTFLPDTYGIDAFLNNFTLEMSKIYDGVRWDSGNWKEFTDKIINHYQKLNINPISKSIVYSNALDVDESIKINNYCKNKNKASFGIGTHFSNHGFKNSPALNIVIKLNSVFHNGFEVFTTKLSDDKGKEQGDKTALRVAKYTFFNQPLDI